MMDDVFGVVLQVLNLTVLAMNVFVKMDYSSVKLINSEEEPVAVSISLIYQSGKAMYVFHVRNLLNIFC